MDIYALIPLISLMAYCVLLVIVLRQPQRRVRRIFALYLASIMIWNFNSFVLHADFFRATLIWNRILFVAAFWSAVAYYHFVRAFVNKPGGLGVYLGYGFMAVAAGLSATDYVIANSYVVNGELHTEFGPLLYLFGVIGVAIGGLAVYFLLQQYRSSFDSAARNRIAYLLIGIAVMAIFGLSNLTPLVKYPLDHIGTLVNALIITYAIVKYELLGIKFVVRRALAYSLLTVLLTSVYLLLLFLLQTLFHTWIGYTSLALAAAFALLLAVLFSPLRNRIQEWVDRLFYRGTYDYRQMLLTFSDKMSNVLDLDELAQSMLRPVTKAMYATKAALLFPDVERGNFRTQFVQQSATDEPTFRPRFSKEHPVVIWLAKESRAFRPELMDILPEFKGLWQKERDDLQAWGVELLCPIKSKGQLIGILALGRKQSEAPYLDEEENLLMTMASGAAIAMENARMLASIREQQQRVQQLLAQTVEAQEEERKRISVELHDGVAQWLVGALYRVQSCEEQRSDEDDGDLATIESTIDRSLKELRRVMAGLRPPTLDELGLIPALQQALDELRGEGIICYSETVGTPTRLLPSIEIATYRIVQEALNNVRKHAKATTVSLRLEFQDDNLLIEVRDDGKGFDLSQTLAGAISVGHMGLLGMRQRAEMAGGTLKVETADGAGTSIVLKLPIDHTGGQDEGKDRRIPD